MGQTIISGSLVEAAVEAEKTGLPFAVVDHVKGCPKLFMIHDVIIIGKENLESNRWITIWISRKR